MNILYWALGIIAILAAIKIWKHYKPKYNRKKANMLDHPEGDLYTDSYFDEPMIENEGKAAFDAPIDEISKKDEISKEEVNPSSDQILDEEPPKKAIPSKKKERKSEMIIALYVITKNEIGFTGTDVLTVLEDLGLKYGKMSIFHHYGVGELKVQEPVYSVANMVEPGIFDPQYMSNFNTSGLALFMRLPGPFGGRVAFELILNHAQRIAESLDGILVDEGKVPLVQKKIGILRDRIANFEQRSSSLSMLKRGFRN
ncbi:cell division protein ZipA [Candidatus Marithioploca araucensis]|uniref:Cell division protein ZipA n=1 Tax=Candidatus Marithioploca araucensis TaxID=70273 RepID=A0ABT7VQ09_9GAMM|nr:cell division protein ZipA [Candidatus Marithioploca araucensis]